MEPMALGSPTHSPSISSPPPQWPTSPQQQQFQAGLNSYSSPAGFGPQGGQLLQQQQQQIMFQQQQLQQQQHQQHMQAQNNYVGGGNPFFQNVPTTGQQQQTMMGSGPTPSSGGFLPGYLMGDFSQQSNGRMMSPTKTSQTQPSTPQTPGIFGSSSQATSTPTGTKGFLTAPNGTPQTRTPSEKPGGPPTSGLLSTPKFSTPKHQFETSKGPQFGTPMPNTPQLSFGSTPITNNPGNVSLRDKVLKSNSAQSLEDNTWVTVFGFPPSSSSFILSQFAQCGTILQRHLPPNGNWMHLKYQTKMQAQKALAKSNKVMGGSIMIGVVPCTDPNVEELVANQSQQGGTNVSTPGGPSMPDPSVTNLNTSLAGARLNSSFRPTQPNQSILAQSENINRNTPQKSTSLVGKAMEYIFGW